MPGHQEHLQRWVEASVIDQQTADRISAFEAVRAQPLQANAERPGALEAVLYAGMAVVAVGAFVLAAQRWGDLDPWARVAAPGVPGLLALVLGLALRVSEQSQLRRAGHVALAVSVGLLGGTAAAFGREAQGADDFDRDSRNTLLAVASFSVGLALVLWLVSPSHLQVLALGGSLVFFAIALANWPDDSSVQLFGLVLLAIGVAGLLLTEADLMAPRESARLVFALALVGGPYIGGFDGTVEWAEAGVFVAAAALVALSVIRGSFAYMVIGTGAGFIALVTFIFEHFEEDLGAPVALILSGGILIAAVLGLAQARTFVRARRSPA